MYQRNFIPNNKEKYKKECLKKAFKNKSNVPNGLYHQIGRKAPQNFSIIDNPHETIKYFNDIIEFLGKVKDFVIFNFDLSEIKNITIDAIIYMIAISKNIYTKYTQKFSVIVPNDRILKKFVLSSGITDFFDPEGIEVFENNDYFSIKMGNKTEVELAQSICDFTIKNLEIGIKDTKFLYDMLVEMMTNTGHHAYNKSEKIKTQWLIFAEYIEDSIRYTFIDTGKGIPATMSKYVLVLNKSDVEKDGVLKNFMDQFSNYESNDTLLLLTGLKGGSLRTRTEKSYRGKGLPEIYNHYKKGNKTSKLKIISGSCLCEFNEENREEAEITELDEKFIGTLFYWEIKKSDLLKGRT